MENIISVCRLQHDLEDFFTGVANPAALVEYIMNGIQAVNAQLLLWQM